MDINRIDAEWASMFHNVVDEILAPRGYEDHHSGKRIAKLEFLTEDKVKKTANATKRVLDQFKQRLQMDITNRIHNMVHENEVILERINKEKSVFFIFRDSIKICELEQKHFKNAMMLRLLPEFIKSVHEIKPY